MSGPAFLSETRERFLKAILAQLPVDRVRELYLFQPMKQGGVESGVAVVAGYSEEAMAEAAARAAEGLAPEAQVAEVAPVAASQEAVDDAAQADADQAETVAEAGAADAGSVEPMDEPPTVDLEEVTGEAAEALACEVVAADTSSDDEAATDEDAAIEAEPTATDEEPDSSAAPAPAAPPEKYTVYTARYRHVLKGPDRGKWEASLVAEAEAPLLSIETVVRGVQRRSGDVEAPDHMTAADIRAALRLTNPSTSDAA